MGIMDVEGVILGAKLGRTRKDAQEDTCAVFAAALYDALSRREIPCRMVTAVKRGSGGWAHSIVEVAGRYYDSMGEFSTSIYRDRARIHPSVTLTIDFEPDNRDQCFDPEFDELHAFYVKMLQKSMQRAVGA